MTEEQGRTIEWLEKHIVIWEKEKKDLDKRINEAYKVVWDLKADERKPNCKKELSPQDMICVGCERAKPDFWNNEFSYPGSQKKFYFTEMDSKTRDCDAWKKKIKTVACGCSGKHICKCGYEEAFCAFLDELPLCPFCGRTCEEERFGGLSAELVPVDLGFEKKPFIIK